MEKGLRHTVALPGLVKKAVTGRLDRMLDWMALLDRSRRIRQLMYLAIRGIQIEDIPDVLNGQQAVILVSNYPSISQSLRAVIKVGCRISIERPRLKAIARPEVVTEASIVLRALGIGHFVFPVHKDQSGAYRLHGQLAKDVLRWLDGPGNVLWLSATGRTRGNGLLEGDLRTGAAMFALRKGVPLVPMALETKEKKGRPRVVRVSFAAPIYPETPTDVDEFERTDYLIDLTKVALCEVAQLLPRGQRGDFEDADQKLAETRRRLGIE